MTTPRKSRAKGNRLASPSPAPAVMTDADLVAVKNDGTLAALSPADRLRRAELLLKMVEPVGEASRPCRRMFTDEELMAAKKEDEALKAAGIEQTGPLGKALDRRLTNAIRTADEEMVAAQKKRDQELEPRRLELEREICKGGRYPDATAPRSAWGWEALRRNVDFQRSWLRLDANLTDEDRAALAKQELPRVPRKRTIVSFFRNPERNPAGLIAEWGLRFKPKPGKSCSCMAAIDPRNDWLTSPAVLVGFSDQAVPVEIVAGSKRDELLPLPWHGVVPWELAVKFDLSQFKGWLPKRQQVSTPDRKKFLKECLRCPALCEALGMIAAAIVDQVPKPGEIDGKHRLPPGSKSWPDGFRAYDKRQSGHKADAIRDEAESRRERRLAKQPKIGKRQAVNVAALIENPRLAFVK